MPTKAEVTRELVREHFRIEEGLDRVAVMRATESDPIKLLEVNANTLSTGNVEVFSFSPTREIPFVTEIAEITPEEFERLQGRTIRAPAGWSIEDVVEVIERPAA